MTDVITRQTIPASFRGVTFNVREESRTSQGRRVVLHEYPNSDRQFVQDLGQLPPRFSVEAFVHGRDFRQRAQALRSALAREGPGQLYLPTFGPATVYALPFTEDSSQSSLGIIRFTLEFVTGRPTPGPAISALTIEDVFDRGDAARITLRDILETAYVVGTTAYNLATAEYDVRQIVAAIVGQLGTQFETGALSGVESTENGILDSRTLLVRSGTALSQALILGENNTGGLLQTVSAALSVDTRLRLVVRLTTLGNNLSNAAKDLLSSDPNSVDLQSVDTSDVFDMTIPGWAHTTPERTQRDTNRRRLVEAARVGALLIAYERAAAALYTQEADILRARAALEEAYQATVRSNLTDPAAIQSRADVRAAIQSVREAALSVLAQKRLLTPGVTSVRVGGPQSALTVAYALYAEGLTDPDALETQARELRELNPDVAATRFTGDLQAFEVA